MQRQDVLRELLDCVERAEPLERGGFLRRNADTRGWKRSGKEQRFNVLDWGRLVGAHFPWMHPLDTVAGAKKIYLRSIDQTVEYPTSCRTFPPVKDGRCLPLKAPQ